MRILNLRGGLIMSEELFETFGEGNLPKLREILSSLSEEEQDKILNMSFEDFIKWEKEHGLGLKE